jgi:hypothetical protein
MVHEMVGYVEVELDEREGGEGPDRLAAEGKVALDVSDVAVVAVGRLLDNGVCVSLEVPDEPPLARLGCCLDGVLPEPKGRSVSPPP